MAEERVDQEQAKEQTTEGQPIPIKVHIKKDEEPIRVTDKRFWVQPEGKDTEESAFSLKPTYIQELEKKLSESQKKRDEAIASYREFKAESALEIQRSRERIQNEYNKRLAAAKAGMARKFITILENLDRAMAASEEAQNFASLLEGVKLIRNQFNTALSELGLEEIKAMNEPFNPEVAEAVETIEVENEAEDNRVLEVVSKGYRMEGVLVRPAHVKVGKSKTSVSESAPS